MLLVGFFFQFSMFSLNKISFIYKMFEERALFVLFSKEWKYPRVQKMKNVVVPQNIDLTSKKHANEDWHSKSMNWRSFEGLIKTHYWWWEFRPSLTSVDFSQWFIGHVSQLKFGCFFAYGSQILGSTYTHHFTVKNVL